MNTEQFWRDAEQPCAVWRIVRSAESSSGPTGVRLRQRRTCDSRLHLGPDERDPRPCAPGHRRHRPRAVGHLDHLYSGMLSRPVLDLARRLAETLPAPLCKPCSCHTGAEANEAALQDGQARHREARGRLLRPLLARDDPGGRERHLQRGPGGLWARRSGQLRPARAERLRPAVRGRRRNLDWRRQLDLGFDLSTPSRPAASPRAWSSRSCPPAGHRPPLGYLAALRTMCAERGMLLIVDEAQTGLCRTGDVYAFERDGVIPDILTLSKTLGAGSAARRGASPTPRDRGAGPRARVPLLHHACQRPAARRRRQDRARRPRSATGSTSGRASSALPAQRPGRLALRHKAIGDVRGRGLLHGVELVTPTRPSTARADRLGAAVTRRCVELGLHMNIVQLPGMGGIFRIAPPLTISDDDLHAGVDILDEALSTVLER